MTRDMTNEQYHAAEGLSRSALWDFKKSPAYYAYKYLSGEYETPAETESMTLGTLVHALILEPKEFEKRYFVMPKANRSTKAGKTLYAEKLAEAGDRTLINQEMLKQADSMADQLFGKLVAEGLHPNADFAKTEHSLFWRDEKTGLLLKARPDCILSPVVIDIKTTIDASYRAFQNAAYANGYFLQAGMIYEGLKAIGEPCETFVFACVEKSAPYMSAIYILDDIALQFGIDLLYTLLDDYKKADHNNDWEGYGTQMLTIPNWATIEKRAENVE